MMMTPVRMTDKEPSCSSTIFFITVIVFIFTVAALAIQDGIVGRKCSDYGYNTFRVDTPFMLSEIHCIKTEVIAEMSLDKLVVGDQ